ncbi:MAG: tyrosine-type recombinase/integrase [Pseudonocardiaceae bacterium]
MVEVLGSWVVGPLESYVRGFAAELARRGYTVPSAAHQVGLVAHLSRWMAGGRLDVADLTPAVVERYVVVRRAAGYRSLRSEKALVPLLSYLRSLGVIGEVVPPPARTPGEVLLGRYRDYLVSERGMGARSVRGYVDLVRPFVERCAREGESDLADLAAGEVSSFLVAQSRRLSPKTVQRLASALRSLLRFWHVQGLIGGPLDQAVPKVANRRPGLVRPLQPGEVGALLASCDLATAAGRRDLAILTLLARVGLRAGEVAGLGLDDINWRRGEITIRGKRNRLDGLPLPADVGEAIASYLRDGRPATALDRSVFTRIRAPHQGLTPVGVTQAVAAAARRAGLGVIHAHRLRHSAATSILAEGGSLAEIGQVLRHRQTLTTAAYTKVSIEALRALSRPWPGVS